jgi:tetratricopeptide (TPR) repeat protein
LITSAKMDYFGSSSAKTLRDAIKLLDQAVQLDPNFAHAYCEAAYAHDTLYRDYDPTTERRALGDSAIDKAIRLQPDLPEAHLALAKHLYNAYRDYERARVQLSIARRDLPNDSEAILLEAGMDLRQGSWEKSIRKCEEAVKLDPRNLICVMDLASTLELTRQYDACVRAYDRAIDLAPNYPSLKIQKAAIISEHTGEFTEFRAAIAALPASMANNRDVLIYRAGIASFDRNWAQVEELIEKLNGGEENGGFAYANAPIPVVCYSIQMARLKGERTDANLVFAAARDELQQKVQVSEGELKACLLSQLSVIDALLGKKEGGITEAKHATEMLPISKDAIEGPAIALNLAVVYAWVDEPDLAFEILVPSAKIPAGIRYGSLKCDPLWDPLRKDPRFETLLAELAPKD